MDVQIERSPRFINDGDSEDVLNTGSGLKDVKAAMQAVNEAPIIEPTLEAVKKLL